MPAWGSGQRQIEHGIGSGVIISPDGYIVTNNHVVDGAMEVRVTLHDRRSFPAKVIGTDKLTDLAVVKIDAKDLPAIAWGDSTKLVPGQSVLAIGNPFGNFSSPSPAASSARSTGPTRFGMTLASRVDLSRPMLRSTPATPVARW